MITHPAPRTLSPLTLLLPRDDEGRVMTASSVSESFIRKELSIEALYNDRDLFGLRSTGQSFYDCELHLIGVRGLVMNTSTWGIQPKNTVTQNGAKLRVDVGAKGSPLKRNSSFSPTRKKSVRGLAKERAEAAGAGGGSPMKKPPAPPVAAMDNASTVIAVLYLDGEEVGKTGVCSSAHPDAADPLWMWESEVFYLRIPCTLLSDRYALSHALTHPLTCLLTCLLTHVLTRLLTYLCKCLFEHTLTHVFTHVFTHPNHILTHPY